MNTTPEALKELYVKLGGESAAVADLTTSVEVMNAISVLLGGEGGAVLNPEAIMNIAAVATAGGGESDFSTATITVLGNYDSNETLNIASIITSDDLPELPFPYISNASFPGKRSVVIPLYKGHAILTGNFHSVGGNIDMHDGDGNIWYDITGDCSVEMYDN